MLKSGSMPQVAVEMRSNTLKRASIHSHTKTVDRAVNFLRAWLRETFETRTGARPLPNRFNRAAPGRNAGASTVTRPQPTSHSSSMIPQQQQQQQQRRQTDDEEKEEEKGDDNDDEEQDRPKKRTRKAPQRNKKQQPVVVDSDDEP